MKAALLTTPCQASIVDVTEPVPENGEVLVLLADDSPHALVAFSDFPASPRSRLP